MDLLVNVNYDFVAFYFSEDKAEQLPAPKITFHHIGLTMDPVIATGKTAHSTDDHS